MERKTHFLINMICVCGGQTKLIAINEIISHPIQYLFDYIVRNQNHRISGPKTLIINHGINR